MGQSFLRQVPWNDLPRYSRKARFNMELTERTPDGKDNLKAVYTMIGVISAAIVGFLVWFIYFRPEAATESGQWAVLSTVNAVLNSICTVFLLLGLQAIKKGRRAIHLRYMTAAAITSGLFLISYLTYHHFVGDTKFVNESWIRFVYFFILITHIVLSVVNVPLVFTTLFLAYTKRFSKHRRIARITFPIWLYVSVTGVAVYIFLEFFNA